MEQYCHEQEQELSHGARGDATVAPLPLRKAHQTTRRHVMGAPLGDLDGHAIQTAAVSRSASPVQQPPPSQVTTDEPSAIDAASAVTPAAVPVAPVKRGPFKRTWDYFDEHLGLSALRYPVPRHANTFWYTLGGM